MEDEKKVYIGNLEFTLTEEDLGKAIEEKGMEAKQIKLIIDKFSGKSKVFAFAEFENKNQAEQIIETLNGQELKGRALRVNKVKKTPRNQTQNAFGNQGYGAEKSFV